MPRCAARSTTAPTCSWRRTASAQSDISIRYFRNQILPDVNAHGQLQHCRASAASRCSPLTSIPLGRGRHERSSRSEASARSSATSSPAQFPTWTVGVAGRLSARHQHPADQPRAGQAAVLAGADAAEEPRAADRDAGPRGGAHRCRPTRSASTAARAARELAETAARGRRKEVRRRHPDQLLRLPGAARSGAGPHQRGPRHLGLQQVARRFRSGAGGAAAAASGGGSGGVTSAGSGAIQTGNAIVRQ